MTAQPGDGNSLVWHYTTLGALQLILESRTLLATEVNYQNDPLEPETARAAIRKALSWLSHDTELARFAARASSWLDQWESSAGFIDGVAAELTHTSRFILCGSTDGDNLYAWRTYAATSNQGCAIGLDPTVPLGVVATGADARRVAAAPWGPVIYAEADLLRFAIEKLREVGRLWAQAQLDDHNYALQQEQAGVPPQDIAHGSSGILVLLNELSRATAAITAVAKHGSFSDEHETRVTVSDAARGVVFTPGINGPRPRIRLTPATQWGEVVSAPSQPLPIRAIMLAPTASGEAEMTARWLLYANGYPLDPVRIIDESGPEPYIYTDPEQAIRIRRSTHPFRRV